MSIMFHIFTAISAILSIYIFYMEAVAWGTKKVNETFLIKDNEEAETTKFMAFNQGFYNLFLGIGMLIGLFINSTAAEAIGIFCLASMLLAALVLFLGDKKYFKPALSQGLAPFIALLFYLLTCL